MHPALPTASSTTSPAIESSRCAAMERSARWSAKSSQLTHNLLGGGQVGASLIGAAGSPVVQPLELGVVECRDHGGVVGGSPGPQPDNLPMPTPLHDWLDP